jgi:hypothetical protein
METNVRKMVTLGAAVLVLAFASREAGAMGGGNLAPDASPYALLNDEIIAAPPLEGRSAYQPSARQDVGIDKRRSPQRAN